MRRALTDCLSVVALLAALLLVWIWREGEGTPPPARYENPLYARLAAEPAARDLDLSFLRAVSEDRVGPGPLANPLFASPRHSFDVILFGDSTLAWGTLAPIIAQRSGLKVALFAYESAFQNRRMAPIYDAIARSYLKPGGLAVFSFAAWTQVAEPDLVRLYADDFARLAQRIAPGGELRADAPATATPLSAPAIEGWRHRMRAQIFGARDARAPALRSLPAQTPDSAARNAAAADGLLDIEAMHPRFLRADASAVTVMVDAAAALRSSASHEPSVYRRLEEVIPHPLSRGYFETNAAVVRALAATAPYRAVFMIPIYAAAERGSYLWQRAVYELRYADRLCLIDLGALHPTDGTLPVGKEGHVVNEGGLVKSILIGDALKAGQFACPAARH